MSFLTVEDVNTVNLNNINEFHEIDTSKISLQEFENVLYDFVICNHSISGGEHTFTFEIHNSLWSRLYHVANANDVVFDYFDVDVSFNNGILTVVTTDASIKLRLLLSSYYKQDEIQRTVTIPVNPVVNLDKSQPILIPPMPIEIYDYYDDEVRQRLINSHIGHNVYRVGDREGYVLINTIKTDLIYDLSETVLNVGSVNHVRLNVDDDYIPGGDLTDDNELDIVVKYGAQEIPCEYDEDLNDYCFDLDLTKKIDNKPIKLEVIVYESKYVNGGIFNHNVNCQYVAADSFSSLQSLITLGNEIIELSSDITFTSNLSLPQNLYLIGNDHQIFMGNYSVVLENVSCKCEKVSFNDGNPIFIQGADSKLNVVGCVFNNANISDEYKGSVLSTLNKSNITSTFSGCSILNCHHSIWHCGTLIIDNCKALFNDFNNSVDTDYSAFLTAHDCQIEITNSIFDIDYTDLCSDEIDIKYAETLICLGENAIMNGVTVDKLTADNTLPLCTSQYNNQSHIYCKYYYPAIEECVIASPLPTFEDKAVCHTIMGQDWIYKNNVQITKASTGNENNNRKIIWEE